MLVGGICRQRLGLAVVEILQAVFQVAQEPVCRGKFFRRRGGQQVARRQRGQHVQRRPLAQFGIAPAADELEQLHDEFDFADAAGSELDVVPHVAALDLAPDLVVQLAQRCECAVVKVAAEHERAHQVKQFLRAIAAYDAPLDPRIAFPLAALRHEVVFEHAEAARERPVGAERPQSHVDAEYVTIGGHFGEQRNQPARETREVFMVAERPGTVCFAVLGVSEHEVDVGRHVELAAAELAHADHV